MIQTAAAMESNDDDFPQNMYCSSTENKSSVQLL